MRNRRKEGIVPGGSVVSKTTIKDEKKTKMCRGEREKLCTNDYRKGKRNKEKCVWYHKKERQCVVRKELKTKIN